MEEHTLDHFREIWYPRLFDRSTTGGWRAAGSREFQERLQEQTLQLMEHEPEPLPADTLQEIEDLAARWSA